MKIGDIMKLKLFAVLFLMMALIVSGCVDEGTEVIEEESPEDVQVNETPMEEENLTEEEEDVDDDKLNIIESEEPRIYTVRLENFLAQPSNLTINKGDSIAWINFNNPKRLFTVVSNEGEWDNFTLNYRKQYDHTFNESGTYTYYILGFEERMKGTIIVK